MVTYTHTHMQIMPTDTYTYSHIHTHIHTPTHTHTLCIKIQQNMGRGWRICVCVQRIRDIQRNRSYELVNEEGRLRGSEKDLRIQSLKREFVLSLDERTRERPIDRARQRAY